jgi:carboxymethylenebutenolidase
MLRTGETTISLDQSGSAGLHAALGGYNPSMGAYLAVPQGKRLGAIVLIQEIFGVTPAMRAIADEYAHEGYAVVVPDIYWRLQRNLDLGNGEEPAERDAAVAYSKRYDEILGTADLVAAVDWLAKEFPQGSRPAVMGFCLGGRMAVRVAAKASVSCMVSMYGVGLAALGEEIKSITGAVQFHFGENDNHNPMSVIDQVRLLMGQRQRADDEFFTYPDVEHAFYNRFRLDRFNAAAHDTAKGRVLAFLERHVARAK